MFSIALPSGKQITFRTTSFRERRHLAKMYNRNDGYLLEEMMASAVLVSVDGVPVAEEWVSDPISRLDDWTVADVQYYLEVFLTINSIDEVIRERAQEQAKKLMAPGPTQPMQASGTKPKALRVNSGPSTED